MIARHDTSRCPSGGPCGEDAEQVFLIDRSGRWSYLTSGTGITCEQGAVFPEALPEIIAACEALGLR